MYRSTAYVWFDTEYSSLEIESAVLLQVAMRITDADLQPLDPLRRDLNVFVKLPDGAEVSPWIKENMPDIVARCRSNEAMEIGELDAQLAATVDRVVTVPGGEYKRRPILAGNSIHADWYLATKFLPRFLARLHYRHLDVTALKIQWQDLHPGEEEFEKENAALIARHCPEAKIDPAARRHDAYYDVQASIAELNFYRSRLFTAGVGRQE
jgi:oligoribonuclease